MPHLNDKFIKSMPLPEGKDKIYYDDKVTGLGVRITRTGSISFFLRYVLNGRETKFKIGNYPELTCTAARDITLELKADIARGRDPHEEKRTIRSIPTVKKFAEDYLATKEKTLRASTFRDYRDFFLKNSILPRFGQMRIDAVTKRDVEAFYFSLSKTPAMANKTLRVLSSLFQLALSWSLITINPAVGIKKFSEHRRERYLSPEEIERLITALDSDPNLINANIIKLILLTGSRKSEVLSARWEDFDLKSGIWSKPAFLTKQNKSSRIPLNQEAVIILKGMKKNGEFIFPNAETGKHTQDIKRFWARICKKAEIENARIHDLRHTFASILVSNGVSLEVIGKLVGHSNIKTTQRYSHLVDGALKNATEALAGKIIERKTSS